MQEIMLLNFIDSGLYFYTYFKQKKILDQMQQNNIPNSPLFIDSEFVPSDFHYITVTDQKITNLSIVVPLREEMNIEQIEQSVISSFTTRQSQQTPSRFKADGSSLTGKQSIKSLKKKQFKKQFDGQQFESLVKTLKEIETKRSNIRTKQQLPQSLQKFELCFMLNINREEVFTLQFKLNKNVSIYTLILQEISLCYKKDLQEGDISISGLKIHLKKDNQSKGYFVFDSFNIVDLEEHVLNMEGLIYLQVYMKTDKIRISQLNRFKKNETEEKEILIKFRLQNKQEVLLDLQKIKNFKVKYILQIIGAQNPQSKGMKILNKIILPNEQLTDIRYILSEFKMHNFIEAVILSESQCFFEQINQYSPLNKHELNQIVSKSNFFRELLSQKRQKSKMMGEINPLLIFNSQFRHEGINNQSRIFFQVLHKFIRNFYSHYQSAFELSTVSRFIKNLSDQVQKLKPFQGAVYRRVYYELECQENDVLQFKNFIVASKNSKIANSAKNINAKKITCITILSKTGKQISQYSSFGGLQEVIFKPYTKFVVSKKAINNKNKIQLVLEQYIEQPKYNKVYAFIWLDSSQKEPIRIFTNMLHSTKSLILKTFNNTSHFIKWVDQSEYLHEDSIEKIVITNMKRKEDGIQNASAGIQTINKALYSFNKAKIIAYVGHIQGTRKVLQAADIDLNKIAIVNQTSQLLQELQSFQLNLNLKITKKAQIKKPVQLPQQKQYAGNQYNQMKYADYKHKIEQKGPMNKMKVQLAPIAPIKGQSMIIEQEKGIFLEKPEQIKPKTQNIEKQKWQDFLLDTISAPEIIQKLKSAQEQQHKHKYPETTLSKVNSASKLNPYPQIQTKESFIKKNYNKQIKQEPQLQKEDNDALLQFKSQLKSKNNKGKHYDIL